MEGGAWGLVIIASAFMIQVLTFGTTASVGVYNIELLDYFDGATLGVSLIGSINLGVYLGCGPIVSYLMTKFSHRKIALFGSALVVVGLLALPLLPYIPSMCFFFGVLTGFGNGCTYIPSHVLTGLYYDRYRSLATGLTTSGSGLGGAVMPVLAGLLIEVYTWKLSLLFVAGFNLHLFIFSALLREPECDGVGADAIQEMIERVDSSIPDFQTNRTLSTKSGVSGHDGVMSLQCVEEDKVFRENPSFESEAESVFIESLSEEKKSLTRQTRAQSGISVGLVASQSAENHKEFWNRRESNSDLRHNWAMSYPWRQRSSHRLGRENRISLNECDITWTFEEEPRQTTDHSAMETLQLLTIPDKAHIRRLPPYHPHSLSLHSFQAAVGARGSSLILFEEHSLQHRPPPQNHVTHIPHLPRSARHIYIFTNYGFDIYFLSNIMWNAGYSIIIAFSPEFLQEKGLTAMEAAWLSGAYGLGCFMGGILGGVFGNLKWVNRQLLYTMANVAMGLITFAVPSLNSFFLYALTLILGGLAFGVVLGLLIVVLTDLIGVESLGNGLGYLMLSNGLGTFIGPPIASMVKDATGKFESSILLSGVLSIMGGLVMLLMPCRTLCHTKSRDPVVAL